MCQKFSFKLFSFYKVRLKKHKKNKHTHAAWCSQMLSTFPCKCGESADNILYLDQRTKRVTEHKFRDLVIEL
jgi:hypothetical protein